MQNPDWLNDESVPVVVTDEEGIITRVSRAFETAFGWEGAGLAAGLSGKPVSEIIPPNLRDAHNMGVSRYLLSKKSTLLDTPLELEILRGDGRVVAALHFITAVVEGGGPGFAARIEAR